MATYSELLAKYNKLKAEGKSESTSKSFAKIKKQLQADPTYQLVKTISNQVVELDRQIDELTPYLSLTDQEKQAFLDKAIEQITPYYERKQAEIEAGIKEGKVRTAEEILQNIRTTEEETKQEFAEFDLTQAKTEEDFLNKITNITATKDEDIAVKREDYRQRMENMKVQQIQSGTLTSGIGAKKRAEQENLKAMEEAQIQRQAEASTAATTTAKEYTIGQVQLARQAAEQQRIRKIGTPSEVASTQAAAMQTTGIEDMTQLKSPEELQRLRAERGIKPIYDQTELPELQADKQKAQYATQQELQADELARREATYGASITKIKAEQAKKASQLASLRGY